MQGRAARARGIESQGQPRREVVAVAREVVGEGLPADVGDRVVIVGPVLPLVAQARLDGQLAGDAPIVLYEERDVPVPIGSAGSPVALDVRGGDAQGHGLDGRDGGGQQAGDGGQGTEQVAASEVQRQGGVAAVHDVEVEAGLGGVAARGEAQRLGELEAVVGAGLRREALAAHAGHPGHLERRAALIEARAGSPAIGIEGVDVLLLVRPLEARLAEPARREDVGLGHGEAVVLAELHGAAAARDEPPERLDVLVRAIGVVGPQHQAVARSPVVIDLPEQERVLELVRIRAGLDGEPRATEDGGVLVGDGHEAVGVDVEALEGQEEERLVLADGTAKGGAVLPLLVRRFRPIGGAPEDVEALEVVLGVQGIIADEGEDIAAQLVRSALGHDVDDATRGLAELRGVGVGEHLELAHRFLAEGGAHGADDGIVVVEAVHHDVVRARALAGEGQAGSGGGALLRRVVQAHPGGDDREADEVASVDGQVLDLRLADHGRHCRAMGIDDAQLLGHGDLLSPAPDGQGEIELEALPEVQGHAFAPLGGEALHLRGDPVGAGGQGPDEVPATRVADGGARGIGVHRGRGHGRPRNGGRGRVADGAAEVGSGEP